MNPKPSPQAPGPEPVQGVPAPEMGQKSPQKSPIDLLATAMSNLMQVGEMMSQSKAISPQELSKYGQLVSQLQQFIEQDLGSDPSQKQAAPQGPQPAQGQIPQQMGGNPKAMPAPPY